MARTRSNVIVVGGGIVGLATALQLQQARPDVDLTVLDKEPEVGRHQTGHNSSVLHSGIYYKPGSTKALTCRAGRSAMVDFCVEHGIDHDIAGKVIVATERSQLEQLDTLEQRAEANGVRATRIDGDELREREPHVAGIAALHVPDAGIVDYGEVCTTMARLLTERGARVATGAEVVGLTETRSFVRVDLASGETLTAELVITCGGLQGDRLARHVRPDLDTRILPFRGEYYEVVPERRSLVRNLIYPVPDPRFPFLGVHLTRMIDGSIHAGPNAVLALAREGYTWRDVNVRDLTEIARFGGWWKLAARYWRTGLGEYRRSLSKAAFVRALQRLVPELTAEDLEPSPAGVRAQAVSTDGDLLDDFVWSETDRVVSVLNAPSPAATASLAIGEQVAERAVAHLA
ncbi:MAG: L-2-hydroxyglutarate oxidase [Actinomycetota bacterium]